MTINLHDAKLDVWLTLWLRALVCGQRHLIKYRLLGACSQISVPNFDVVTKILHHNRTSFLATEYQLDLPQLWRPHIDHLQPIQFLLEDWLLVLGQIQNRYILQLGKAKQSLKVRWVDATNAGRQADDMQFR